MHTRTQRKRFFKPCPCGALEKGKRDMETFGEIYTYCMDEFTRRPNPREIFEAMRDGNYELSEAEREVVLEALSYREKQKPYRKRVGSGLRAVHCPRCHGVLGINAPNCCHHCGQRLSREVEKVSAESVYEQGYQKCLDDIAEILYRDGGMTDAYFAIVDFINDNRRAEE